MEKVETENKMVQCKCGGDACRMKKRTRHGMRWIVRCSSCKKKTHLHRSNGGDIEEWNEMNAPC